MRKTWIYSRDVVLKSGKKRYWYVAWYDRLKKQRTKTAPTKALAQHIAKIKYYQLNADVFIGAINIGFAELKKQYLHSFDVRQLTSSAKYEANLTLRHFERIIGTVDSKNINQVLIDRFILQRSQKVKRYTLNKDISNLRAFINWGKNKKRNYITGDIEIQKVKTPQIIFKALTTEQIRFLLKRCPSQAWRIRIILSLVTGLRSSDIDDMKVTDIDLKTLTLDSKSQKTGKIYIGRPIPKAAASELNSYLATLENDQVKLFTDNNIRNTWEQIRGGSGITRQHLRKTFSTLIQKTGSLGSAQELLEHYDSKTTGEFYTDRELILRWKVEQLPVNEWLSKK